MRVELPEAPDPATRARARACRTRSCSRTTHLLVVDKPAGVVVHPAPGHPTGTLAQALAGRAAGGPDPWRPGIVHRLDRDTSGLMVVAKSDAVHRALQEMIRAREVEREYLALVEGRPDARTRHDRRADRPRPDATASVMSVRSDSARERAHPLRGRGDLPAHDAAARAARDRAHPPDPRPHGRDRPPDLRRSRSTGGPSPGARLGLTRQFLHSARLRFRHPISGADTVLRVQTAR